MGPLSGARAQDLFTSSVVQSGLGIYTQAHVGLSFLSLAQQYATQGDTNGTPQRVGFSYNTNPVSLGLSAGYEFNRFFALEGTVFFPISAPRGSIVSGARNETLVLSDIENTDSVFYPTSNNGVFSTNRDENSGYFLGYSAMIRVSYQVISGVSVYAKVGAGGLIASSDRVAFIDQRNAAERVITNVQINAGLSYVNLAFGGGVRVNAWRGLNLSLEYEQTSLGGAGVINGTSPSLGTIRAVVGYRF